MKKRLIATIAFIACASFALSASQNQPSALEKIKRYLGLSTSQKTRLSPDKITEKYQNMAQKELDQQRDLPICWTEELHTKLIKLREKQEQVTFWGRQSPSDTRSEKIEKLAMQERHYFHQINQQEWKKREEDKKKNNSEVDAWKAQEAQDKKTLREIQTNLQETTNWMHSNLNMGAALRKYLNQNELNQSNSDQVKCQYGKKDETEKKQKALNKDSLNDLINKPFDLEKKLLQDHIDILLEECGKKTAKNESIKSELDVLSELNAEKEHFIKDEVYVKYAMIDSSLQLITPKDENKKPIVKSYPLPLEYRWYVDKKHNPRLFPFNNTIETKRVRHLVRDYYSEQQSKE